MSESHWSILQTLLSVASYSLKMRLPHSNWPPKSVLVKTTVHFLISGIFADTRSQKNNEYEIGCMTVVTMQVVTIFTHPNSCRSRTARCSRPSSISLDSTELGRVLRVNNVVCHDLKKLVLYLETFFRESYWLTAGFPGLPACPSGPVEPLSPCKYLNTPIIFGRQKFLLESFRGQY